MLVAELWAEAGLPDGVFNVVNGDKVAVDALLDHPGISAVSFVGSTPIARYVYSRATASGKRAQALGGAKNHAVVLPDADLDFAADHVVAAAFGSAGERCMAISAAVAVGDAGDALVGVLRDKGSGIRVGPGRDEQSEMGPVITLDAKNRILGYIDRSEQAGAHLALDGRGIQVAGHENGFFVGPTIIDQVTPAMEVYRDEIFGPVLSVLRAETADEAVALINSNPYGNGTALFTSSGEAARRFHRGVNVGMVGINVPIPVPMAYYSFGGWKDSLFGERRVHGPEGVSFYTRAKVVTSRWPAPEGVDRGFVPLPDDQLTSRLPALTAGLGRLKRATSAQRGATTSATAHRAALEQRSLGRQAEDQRGPPVVAGRRRRHTRPDGGNERLPLADVGRRVPLDEEVRQGSQPGPGGVTGHRRVDQRVVGCGQRRRPPAPPPAGRSHRWPAGCCRSR